MSGHHPFRELTKDFSPERQARIADKVRLFKQDMALAELRKARQQSQAELAARLHVNQPAIAKMERRTDMYVSNLRRFVEAMGGTLSPEATPGGGLTMILRLPAADIADHDAADPRLLERLERWPERPAVSGPTGQLQGPSDGKVPQ